MGGGAGPAVGLDDFRSSFPEIHEMELLVKVLMGMAQRPLASKLWLAAAAKCVHRMDNRRGEIAIAQIFPRGASGLADVGGGIRGGDDASSCASRN